MGGQPELLEFGRWDIAQGSMQSYLSAFIRRWRKSWSPIYLRWNGVCTLRASQHGQFKAAMESHVSAWGSERTEMGRRSATGKRTRAFPDKHAEKAGSPSSPADGWTWMSRGSTR